MTSEKELKITIDELTQVAWKCSSCGAEQAFEIASDEQVQSLQFGLRHFACSICQRSYSEALFQAMQALLTFHKRMKESEDTMFFRIAIEGTKL